MLTLIKNRRIHKRYEYRDTAKMFSLKYVKKYKRMFLIFEIPESYYFEI